MSTSFKFSKSGDCKNGQYTFKRLMHNVEKVIVKIPQIMLTYNISTFLSLVLLSIVLDIYVLEGAHVNVFLRLIMLKQL